MIITFSLALIFLGCPARNSDRIKLHEIFTVCGYFLMRLPGKVKSWFVLPMWALYTDMVFWHPVPPDTLVCGLHQRDCDLDLDISIRH